VYTISILPHINLALFYVLLTVHLYIISGMQDFTLHARQSAIRNNKYPMSQKHSCSSWWWT